jgi:HSP20 family protein
MALPKKIEAHRVQSKYEYGVLTITLPEAEEKKRKKIKIQIANDSKAVEIKKEKQIA